MSFPGNINLNDLASLMASAGGAGAFPGLNAAAMAAAAASQPSADGSVASGAPAAAATDADMINTIEKNLYHDNSRVTPADVDANPRARRANSKREPTFPMKLHSLLSDPEAEGVIVWLPHGRAWKIVNQDKFETGLLGKYFEHGNMSSFMRQVNGWDFRRVVKGVDEQSYYHELFLRGMPHLCRCMTRTKAPKKQLGALCSPKVLSITPDFYRISRDHPLPETNMPDSAPSSSSSHQHVHRPHEGLAGSVVPQSVAQQAAAILQQQQQQQQNQGQQGSASASGNGSSSSDAAAQALQNYILQDTFAGAQGQQLTNLQAFQQRLQARSILVDSLRNMVSQPGASSATGTAGTGGNNMTSGAATALFSPQQQALLSQAGSAGAGSNANLQLTDLLRQQQGNTANANPTANLVLGSNPSLNNLGLLSSLQQSGSGTNLVAASNQSLNNLLLGQQQSGSGNNLVATSNPSLNNLLLGQQQQQNGSNSNLNLALLMEITRNSAAGGGGGASGTAGTQNATW
eukprot:CAMPEP_0181040918 /NCGR_PEP_ID=MMETSP1070-20121207/11317_1 /TAXON_ID=265543 /ORGANISM="Minutocellus polymorphus, Strain NH13" /LENGTH=516 /DNA_ID=CAMNT_0023118985 /DNA_START=150 /DNA_END=1700 /DNA_ORIENTATION=+